MKANEIRLGNYVLCKGYEVKVLLIGKYGIQARNNNTDYNCKFRTGDINPIPLTEEILLKCGFRHSGDLDLELPNALLSYVVKEKKMYLMVGQFAECTDTVPCEFLHQLQNLIYSLTGEELNVTL